MSYTFAEIAAPEGAPLLVLLHGTGGDENDLLPLGKQLLAGAHIISLRGDVSEGGALRFFKRTSMGVYDMDDLARATEKLAGFISEQVAIHRPPEVMALGLSNGANLLASLLFSHPELIAKAVLMHPLIPFGPPSQPGLAGRPVLITAGRQDPIAPVGSTQQLLDYFTAQGAKAQITWHNGGHEVRQVELLAARDSLNAKAA
jgi:phospholipase/carboxylesterase